MGDRQIVKQFMHIQHKLANKPSFYIFFLTEHQAQLDFVYDQQQQTKKLSTYGNFPKFLSPIPTNFTLNTSKIVFKIKRVKLHWFWNFLQIQI